MSNSTITVELIKGVHAVGEKTYRAGDRFECTQRTAESLAGKVKTFITGVQPSNEITQRQEEATDGVQTGLGSDTKEVVAEVPKKRTRRKKRNTK
jgi:hypothetical protein